MPRAGVNLEELSRVSADLSGRTWRDQWQGAFPTQQSRPLVFPPGTVFETVPVEKTPARRALERGRIPLVSPDGNGAELLRLRVDRAAQDMRRGTHPVGAVPAAGCRCDLCTLVREAEG